MSFTDQGPPPAEEVLSSLQLELTVPYSRLLLPSQAELPSTCLALGVLDSWTRWYIFADAEELRQTRAELTRLMQVSRGKTRRTAERSFIAALLSNCSPNTECVGRRRRIVGSSHLHWSECASRSASFRRSLHLAVCFHRLTIKRHCGVNWRLTSLVVHNKRCGWPRTHKFFSFFTVKLAKTFKLTDCKNYF